MVWILVSQEATRGASGHSCGGRNEKGAGGLSWTGRRSLELSDLEKRCCQSEGRAGWAGQGMPNSILDTLWDIRGKCLVGSRSGGSG